MVMLVDASGLETTGPHGTTNATTQPDMLNMGTLQLINIGLMTQKIGIGNMHISSMDKICLLSMPMETSLPQISKPMEQMNM